MQNSLAKRLTYRIMAVLLVMLAVITGFVYVSVRDYMRKEAQERYLGVLQKTYEEFRRRLSDVYVSARNNVHDIERDIEHPDMMYDHMKRIVSLNQGVSSSALLFLPDYYAEKGRFFVPIAKRDSAKRVYIANSDSAYGYHQAPWYKDCLSSDTGRWIGTYFDRSTVSNNNRRTMLTTYAAPVHDHQGTPVGALLVQLSLESMRYDFTKVINEMSEKFEKGQRHHSYCFVVDNQGVYIMHPDEDRVLTASLIEETKATPDSLDDQIVAKMLQGGSGEVMMEVEGIRSWVYYCTVKYVNWTLVIVVPEDIIFHNGRMLNTIILLTMLLGLVAIYFICRHMIRQTTKPLHRFALSADQVALGNFTSSLPKIKGNDEVRLLHDAFENMQTSLSKYVDELRKTTTSKASLERELKIAQGIQMAMLPKTLGSDLPLSNAKNAPVDLYASLTPARDVGGDLYDYFVRDNRLFFCIGDVTGKGVPAALLMAVMRAMFRSEARRADRALDIVETMNRNLSEESSSGYFVTMFVGILDMQTGYLDYCNAGHEEPLISGEPLSVKPNLPVGALPDWKYEGQQIQLKAGDMLFLYTDGLSEAKNTEKKSMGRSRVFQLVQAYSGDTARQLVEHMNAEAHQYAGEAEQSDDITLLAIRWLGDRLMLKPTMDDIGQLKPFVVEAAQRAGIDEKETKRLRLAVEEVVANVINHGEATAITLQTTVDDGQLVLTIDDDGKPFDPTQDSATDLSIPADQRPPGGLGIIFLHQMADGLAYQRTEGHNILKILKRTPNEYHN